VQLLTLFTAKSNSSSRMHHVLQFQAVVKQATAEVKLQARRTIAVCLSVAGALQALQDYKHSF